MASVISASIVARGARIAMATTRAATATTRAAVTAVTATMAIVVGFPSGCTSMGSTAIVAAFTRVVDSSFRINIAHARASTHPTRDSTDGSVAGCSVSAIALIRVRGILVLLGSSTASVVAAAAIASGVMTARMVTAGVVTGVTTRVTIRVTMTSARMTTGTVVAVSMVRVAGLARSRITGPRGSIVGASGIARALRRAMTVAGARTVTVTRAVVARARAAVVVRHCD